MKAQLKRLRLKEGDIIVCRDSETAESLMRIRVKNIPPCPIVVTQTSIHRVSKKFLRQLLDIPAGGTGVVTL